MTKEECTYNTLRVALLIGVATAICHLKEKLKIVSAPIPTDKGQEQSSLRVVQWLLMSIILR